MAKSQDLLAYKLFEADMKERMKPSLLKLKDDEGYEAYFEAIRNTIAGCKAKWKIFPKEVKYEFVKRISKPLAEPEITQLPQKLPANSSEEFSPSASTSLTCFEFRRTRFEELKLSGLNFADKSKIVSGDWEKLKLVEPKKAKKSSKTGYDLFRKEHSKELKTSLGLKGNALSSKVGEAWRKLSVKSKKAYTMKGFVLYQVQDRKPNKITRSKSVASFDGKVVPPTRFSSVNHKEAAILGSTAILVATAVAAKGLGIAEVTNMDNMPGEEEEFVHRIGSTSHVGKATSYFDIETEAYVAGTPVPDLLGEAVANIGGGEESDPYVAGTPVPDWLGESREQLGWRRY